VPSIASPASRHATAIAPDGIAVHTFALPPARLVSVAEGHIPPGTFAIHRHLTLEQYTYVVEGEVAAITGNIDQSQGQLRELRTGDLLLTLPGESLQFRNSSASVARVLFICAPPYPADDSDTRLLEEHGGHSAADTVAALERLQQLRATLNAEIDARIAVLQALLRDSGAS
jgi:mannose-6-phosphate isomerase-like protein (cupin superfamily)